MIGRISVTDDLVTGIDRVTSFGYDSMGRHTATTLPDNTITHTSYWPAGQVKANWGSQTNPTVKFYTAQGQLEKLRTFRSADLALAPDETTVGYDETTWIHNHRDQLESKEYADGKGTDYTYTDGGRLRTRRWQRGNWTRYDYDTAGSLKATLYFTATTTESAMLAAATGNDPLTPDVFVLNDKLGRPDTVTQTNQSLIAYTYDPANLALDTETVHYDLDHDGTHEFTRVLDRSRDSLGRDTGYQLKGSVGVPPASFVESSATYGYHATDGRLQSVSDAASSFTYGYTPNSSLIHTVTATAGAVHTVTNTWEPTRDVLDIRQNKVGTDIVSQYDYAVNSIGQRTGVATSGTAFPATPSWAWGYDSLGQVTSADSSVSNNDRAYEYDAIGNRKKSADGLTLPASDNYTSNALNQYSEISNSQISNPSYDDDGNATAYPLPVAPTTNSALVWDGENRMISSTVGTTTTAYLYDAQSRRIAVTTGGTSTLFVYDGWNCIAEYASTTLSKTRLWGTDLSGSMQGAGGVGGLLSESHISNPQSPIYYPLYDGNGNVSEYLAANGTTAAHFEYDPFGNTVVDTDTANEFAYRFSTKLIDSTTGLSYYGYRYYDPVTGRWPSRDPIEEEGGVNLYGFVENAGVNGVDNLGLSVSSLIGAAVAEFFNTPNTQEIAIPLPGALRPFCEIFAALTIHDKDKDCCAPFDLAVGVTCKATKVIREITSKLPWRWRSAINQKIPSLASLTVNGQWSSKYCPRTGIEWSGRLGLAGSASFGNGRRGGGTGETFSIGGVLEVGGGYDFSNDSWYGEFTAAGSVGVNVYLPGSFRRKSYAWNRDIELTCPFDGSPCSFEY